MVRYSYCWYVPTPEDQARKLRGKAKEEMEGNGTMAGRPVGCLECFAALSTQCSVIVLTYVISVGNADATTYYASTNGNDNNSCVTAQSPGASAKRNLTGAKGVVEDCMKSGDTVIVQAGSYTLAGMGLFDVIPSGSGETNRTLLKCEGYRTCTLNGQIWLRDNDDYITIQDFKINGNFSELHAITLTATSLTPSLYPSHVKIIGNELYNTTAEVLYDGNGQFNEFLNNYLHDCSGSNCGAIYGLGRDSVYRGNESYRARVGISFHTSGGMTPTNNVIENNKFHDCTTNAGTFPAAGLDFAGTSGNVFRRNVIYNCTYGIRVTVGSASNSDFDHNTLSGNTAGGILATIGSGNRFRNNAVVGNNGTQVSICSGCGTTTTNLMTGTPTTIWTNPTSGDFTLRTSSPAIDACANIGLPFNGSAPDCGAFESGGGSGGGGDTTPPQPPGNLRVQ